MGASQVFHLVQVRPVQKVFLLPHGQEVVGPRQAVDLIIGLPILAGEVVQLLQEGLIPDRIFDEEDLPALRRRRRRHRAGLLVAVLLQDRDVEPGQQPDQGEGRVLAGRGVLRDHDAGAQAVRVRVLLELDLDIVRGGLEDYHPVDDVHDPPGGENMPHHAQVAGVVGLLLLRPGEVPLGARLAGRVFLQELLPGDLGEPRTIEELPRVRLNVPVALQPRPRDGVEDRQAALVLLMVKLRGVLHAGRHVGSGHAPLYR